jgi:hypothetical protein
VLPAAASRVRRLERSGLVVRRVLTDRAATVYALVATAVADHQRPTSDAEDHALKFQRVRNKQTSGVLSLHAL